MDHKRRSNLERFFHEDIACPSKFFIYSFFYLQFYLQFLLSSLYCPICDCPRVPFSLLPRWPTRQDFRNLVCFAGCWLLVLLMGG